MAKCMEYVQNTALKIKNDGDYGSRKFEDVAI